MKMKKSGLRDGLYIVYVATESGACVVRNIGDPARENSKDSGNGDQRVILEKFRPQVHEIS